jgi:hypothetical protein
VLKFIPDKICPELGSKQTNPLENDNSVLGIRKNRTQSFSLRNPGSVKKEGSGRQGSFH